MKMKLVDIKNAEEPLKKIMNKELNIKAAYKVSKVLKIVNSEMTAIEQSRVKLVHKYQEKQEDGSIRVASGKEQQFMNEFVEFLQTDIDIDFVPISIDDLDGISLTPADMIGIDKFIAKEEE